jgi:hypothetical protein
LTARYNAGVIERRPWPDSAGPARHDSSHYFRHFWERMKELGLLWIPAGFALIFFSVAALFLTI